MQVRLENRENGKKGGVNIEVTRVMKFREDCEVKRARRAREGKEGEGGRGRPQGNKLKLKPKRMEHYHRLCK